MTLNNLKKNRRIHLKKTNKRKRLGEVKKKRTNNCLIAK